MSPLSRTLRAISSLQGEEYGEDRRYRRPSWPVGGLRRHGKQQHGAVHMIDREDILVIGCAIFAIFAAAVCLLLLAGIAGLSVSVFRWTGGL